MSLEIIDWVSQAIITCTGFCSLYLMASQEARVRMWGGIIGLSGEPFWLVTATINDQYGVMALCFVYGVNWARVAFSNWRASNGRVRTIKSV